MQGVNPGSRRSKGLCKNVILATGGIEMSVHLHVFDNSPFDILLGQLWKAQYVVLEGQNCEILEMVVCNYQDTKRQVAVVLHDTSNLHWEARLDTLQQPQSQPPDTQPGHHASQSSHGHHFDRQPTGVSPARRAGGLLLAEEWDRGKEAWAGVARKVHKAKYKPVAQKVWPVDGVLPDEARTLRQFPQDPLALLEPLPHHPPPFTPGNRLTREQLDDLIRISGLSLAWVLMHF
ncbi:hypothetical protein BN14_12307 [Rhizoctonia solani AG-1 IB]|uniref:Uncharacterized protein n=1 Tax=Thanatephorus cucumeris (strain AG1-IB / isolate 7/3/14) TaxID=1108050 RepID=M5CHM8_THACB|nr:hypothetical protein BN14_12307 [Rhizoctonia solani AG-1 IB]